MNNQNFNELLNKINVAKNIGIVTHKIPDADAVGSACGLAYTLKQMGKNVEVLFEKPLKSEFDIFNLDDIIAYEPSFEYDLLISTDSGDTLRFGIHEPLYLKHKNTVNIDHHITNLGYADLNYIDANRSSACEYIFHILTELNISIPMQAQRLFYTGIIRDCGAFMHSNTSAETHRIVAKLIDNGVDFDKLNEHFMKTTAYKTIILQKYALNSMEFFENGKIVMMNLPISVFQKENCTIDDTGSIVSMGISIEGVDLAIMCSETLPNVHKISFRSREAVDSSVISLTFGGGGHKRAAGCQLKGSFEHIRKQLLDRAIKEVKAVNNERNSNLK